ncbi:hypothetical protein PR048_010164 [Dryococelus australis]|uniref:Uncharacterized protein n=1 Tax=Dryococelus australis TaxID=614101 RepID=A0ABQ9I1X8_9NEOP|nr:hypothetical protein PR048_010164 [Dryococelus australis]
MYETLSQTRRNVWTGRSLSYISSSHKKLDERISNSYTYVSVCVTFLNTYTACFLLTQAYLLKWGRGCVVVRLIASHLGELGSIPGGVAPGFLWKTCREMPLVGGYSRGSPVYPRPFIPALLYAHFILSPSTLKTSMLRAAKISPLLSSSLLSSHFYLTCSCVWCSRAVPLPGKWIKDTLGSHAFPTSFTGRRPPIPQSTLLLPRPLHPSTYRQAVACLRGGDKMTSRRGASSMARLDASSVFARRGDETVVAHVSVAPSTPMLLRPQASGITEALEAVKHYRDFNSLYEKTRSAFTLSAQRSAAQRSAARRVTHTWLTIFCEGAGFGSEKEEFEKRGSDKDYTATRIKPAIATKRKALNWRAVSYSSCVYL